MLLLHTFTRISTRGRKMLMGLACVLTLLVIATPASASQESNSASQIVKVSNVHIGGYIDPHNQALIHNALDKAEGDGTTLFVIQLDSDGVAGGDIEKIAQDLDESSLITAIWVGPTSAKYSNELDQMLVPVSFVGAANKELAKKSGAEYVASSLREFYAEIDGQNVPRAEFLIDTGCSAEEIADKEEACKDVKLQKPEKFALNIAVTFEKLSPIANLGHSLIRPGFAVGILVLGLCLLAFEYYAASVGVAAIAGSIASMCGLYGLGYLPTHWWAVVLVALGVFALVIDVQAGGVAFYTGLGSLLIFFGSLFATERGGSYEVSWVSALIITVMALLFCVGAIPSLIRTRFGTPTIGREEFIGEEAIAVGDVDPEGTVTLRGGTWKARTNHATPISDGDKCRVVKIEGIVLEVEPLVGAAVDYREKRK